MDALPSSRSLAWDTAETHPRRGHLRCRREPSCNHSPVSERNFFVWKVLPCRGSARPHEHSFPWACHLSTASHSSFFSIFALPPPARRRSSSAGTFRAGTSVQGRSSPERTERQGSANLTVALSEEQSQATVKNAFFSVAKETPELISDCSRVAGCKVNIQT